MRNFWQFQNPKNAELGAPRILCLAEQSHSRKEYHIEIKDLVHYIYAGRGSVCDHIPVLSDDRQHPFREHGADAHDS